MRPLNRTMLAITFTLCLNHQAIAGSDIAPFNGAAGVEIVDPDGEAQEWYPVSPGQSLNYAFAGPGRIWLYVRSGASPRSGVWNFSTEAELSIKTGGAIIERLPQVPALDGFGGLQEDDSFPWIARGVLVDVPGGDSDISIEAALNGPPLLLRVVSSGQSAEPPAEPEVVEEEAPLVADFEEPEEDGSFFDLLVEEPLETPEVTEETTVLTEPVSESDGDLDIDEWALPEPPDESVSVEDELQDTAQPVADETDETPTILDLINSEEDPNSAAEDAFLDEEDPFLEDVSEAETLGTLKDRVISSLQAFQFGGSLGLGAPLRGDSPSPYIGASARIELMPILWDGWNLDWGKLYSQANIGWYRVGVNSDLIVNDVHAGQTELTVQYATSVVPMELSVGIEMPFTLGPVVPIAAIGSGLYLSVRSGEEGSEFDASSGYSALLGGELQLWSGVVGVAFSHTGTSGSLGRIDESGNQANEKLSVERLDLSYLTHF